MSIFKSTFKRYVAEQIATRQNLLSTEGNRPIELQQYVSGKTPWVKMTSFVNYKNSSNLARDHTLFGGTQFVRSTGGGMRYGINTPNAVYGGNLSSKEYGSRPMPGIESISVRSLGAYGSLRETTIKYYAWDLQQLENLSILYMRPGYPVLVEWGWSMYLQNNPGNTTSYNILKDFTLIDCFRSGNTIDFIYDQIRKRTELYDANYDASLGLIKNYSYSMLPNGGFECTTTLISIGDVIDSIKMNAVSVNQTATSTPVSGSGDVKDEFEILMTNLATRYDATPAFSIAGPISTEFDDIDAQIPNVVSNPADLDKNIYKFNTPGFIPGLPDKDDRTVRYVQLAYLIHVINNRVSLYTSTTNTMVKIEIPLPSAIGNKGNGLCVASYNSMTIDNSVCLIYNPQASLVDPDPTIGFAPQVTRIDPYSPPIVTIGGTSLSPLDLKPYLYSGTNLGIIGNIYVNIGRVINVYKSIHRTNNGVVTLSEFFKNLLYDIQYTLGSVNYFDMFVQDNKGIIVDKHYVEDPKDANYSSKYPLNIIGKNCIVREHKLVSKIFQEQSTMIAIAAQDRENVSSVQTSTMVAYNKNISNRLYSRVTNKVSPDPAEEKKSILENMYILITYVRTYVVTGVSPVDSDITVSALNTMLNQLIVKGEKGTDYKGIIPLSFEVTMDGISGFTIGEIFRINTNVLPAMYSDKKVGFIVTGIEQQLSRSDWKTTLKTQFCLLDQSSLQRQSLTDGTTFIDEVKAYIASK